MKSCPYCAQTDTRKDGYGYCKKYNCFEVSGMKDRLKELKEELRKAEELPTYRRNSFDGSVYNPRKNEVEFIYKKIIKEIGFIPMDFLRVITI